MNAARLLHASALAHPGDLAVQRGAAHADYLALSMAAERVATILGQGFDVSPEQRVAMTLPTVPEFASVFFGILWAGAVAAVIDLAPTADADFEISDLTTALRWSEAPVLVAWHADAELAEAGSATQETQCLFVEPREFGRMVAHTSPRLPLADRGPADLAVVGRAASGSAWSFTHGELVDAARELARANRLEMRGALTHPAGTSGRELILALTAASAVGAALVIDEPTVTRATPASKTTATHGVCE